MQAFLPILSLLAVVICSLLVVRVATVALVQTGLSEQLARFQARSAFTTAGFTTSETEQVVNHPVRRRIIMILMLAGNAGLVSIVGSFVAFFADPGDNAGDSLAPTWLRLLVLAAGLFLLWVFASSLWVDRQLSRLIAWALKKYTSLELHDYAGLLHMSGGYVVGELRVAEDDWLAGRTLIELALTKEGVVVLGIEKPTGVYIGAPQGPTKLEAGDTLLVYGRSDQLRSLDDRRSGAAGNWEHARAVSKQKQIEQVEAKVLDATAEERAVDAAADEVVEELERVRS